MEQQLRIFLVEYEGEEIEIGFNSKYIIRND